MKELRISRSHLWGEHLDRADSQGTCPSCVGLTSATELARCSVIWNYIWFGTIIFTCVLIGYFVGRYTQHQNHELYNSPDDVLFSSVMMPWRRLTSADHDDLFNPTEGFDGRKPNDINKDNSSSIHTGKIDGEGKSLPFRRSDMIETGENTEPGSASDIISNATSRYSTDSLPYSEQSGLAHKSRQRISTGPESAPLTARKKSRSRRPKGPDPQAFRKHLCHMFRTDKESFKLWYALLVLYIAEWPAYARRGNGGDSYISYLRGMAEKFEVPRHAVAEVQMLFAEELSCGTPQFFLEGLALVQNDIHKLQDLIVVLKRYVTNQYFFDVLEYTQATKLPADVSVAGFAMLLRTAFEGFAFSFNRKLFLKSRSTLNLTRDELYKAVVEQYHQNQFQYWLLLLMASVMKRIVSSRPHAGTMVIKIDTSEMQGINNSRFANNLDRAALDSMQRQVAASMEGKLDRSMLRFKNIQAVQTPLAMTNVAMRPNVSVTGYLERTRSGEFIEHGIFGIDMETDTLEELKHSMEPGNILVDVSLVDSWSFKSMSEWPDPLQRDALALTAYTSTQLLCAEFQWDPSLGNLGRVQVVYSGFTDVYTSSGGNQQSRAKHDPDVQVLLLRENQKFVEDGLEEGSKKKVTNLVAQEPLQWGKKRVIDPDRIQWRGIAMLLRGGQMYRKKAFGMGLPPALRRAAEELLKPNLVLIHIAIRGLGELSGDTMGFEMTASEMANRLVRRSRGTYDSVLLRSEPPIPKEPEIRGDQRCVGEMPRWVVLVSTLGVALFFIILIGLLMYHNKIRLPWWISCIFSNRAPWDDSSETSVCGVVPEGLEKDINNRDIGYVMSKDFIPR